MAELVGYALDSFKVPSLNHHSEKYLEEPDYHKKVLNRDGNGFVFVVVTTADGI